MIRFAARARIDLRNIAARIVSNNGAFVASRILDKIEAGIWQLERFPYLGRPGRVSDTRELGISDTPYIVVYHPTPDVIFVARVIHSAMLWPPKAKR